MWNLDSIRADMVNCLKDTDVTKETLLDLLVAIYPFYIVMSRVLNPNTDRGLTFHSKLFPMGLNVENLNDVDSVEVWDRETSLFTKVPLTNPDWINQDYEMEDSISLTNTLTPPDDFVVLTGHAGHTGAGEFIGSISVGDIRELVTWFENNITRRSL